MDAAEVRQVSVVVQFVSNDRVPRCLHQIETGTGYQVARRQEMLHLLADTNLRVNHLLEVVGVSDLCNIKFGIS
jgi:hypothetical protein